MFTHSIRSLGFFASVALLAATLGCGGGEKLSAVKGKVVYGDGQPVTSGSITFNNAAKQISATSDIAPDGTFTLQFDDRNGAPTGEYTVVVVGSSAEYGAPPTVAAIYGDPTNTPLRQTISEGPNDLEIKVERP